MKLSALIAKIAGFAGARILGAAAGFLSQLVLARLLPIEDVGVVLLGMSVAAFVGLGANGGYALLSTTELPKLEQRRQPKTAMAFNRVALMDSIFVYLLLCAACWIAAIWFEITTGQKTALLMGFICAPASMTMRYNASIGMAARYFKTAYMPDLIFRPAALLAGLVAAALSGWLNSALMALIIFVLVTYATSIGQAWALKGNRLSLQHLGFPRRFLAKPIRSRALALTLVSATMLAFADIVTLVAGIILPERDVAIIGVAMRVAAIAGFMLQAGQMLVMTDFTQALVRGDEKAVDSILRRVNGLTVAIVLASLAGALVFGEFALGLFGAEYRQGAFLLVLFMIGQSLRALGGMNQQILSINGFQKQTAWASIFALGTLVLFAILFCGNLGSNGLGYAVIIAELLWLLVLAVQSSNLCGRRGDLLWALQRR